MSRSTGPPTNDDLKKLLKAKGLSTSGNKSDLLARLAASNINVPSLSSGTASSGGRRPFRTATVKSTNSDVWSPVAVDRVSRLVEEDEIHSIALGEHYSKPVSRVYEAVQLLKTEGLRKKISSFQLMTYVFAVVSDDLVRVLIQNTNESLAANGKTVQLDPQSFARAFGNLMRLNMINLSDNIKWPMVTKDDDIDEFRVLIHHFRIMPYNLLTRKEANGSYVNPLRFYEKTREVTRLLNRNLSVLRCSSLMTLDDDHINYVGIDKDIPNRMDKRKGNGFTFNTQTDIV
jgi:hypothetical protein